MGTVHKIKGCNGKVAGKLLLVPVAAVAAAVGVLASSRIKTLRSLKKLSAFEGPYNLYEIDIAYRYDLMPLSRRALRTTRPISMPCAARCFQAFR